MPKTVFSKREDLICGKLDVLVEMSIKHNDVEMIHLIDDIRRDAVRMEAKLILRKQEVESHGL